MHKFSSFRILAVLLLIVIILGGCGKKEDYVAKVNGDIITRAELNKRTEVKLSQYELQGFSFSDEQGEELKKLVEQEALYELIQEQIFKQEIEKQGIKMDKDKAEEQIASMEEVYGKETFIELLKAQKISRKDLVNQVAFQMAVEELYQKVTADIEVTEKEANDYFNENKDDLIQVKVSHILASAQKDSATEEERKQAKEKARGWIERLSAGEDFTELAKKESDEPGAENSGGSLGGYFSKSTSNFVPEFTEAAFKIKEGTFSQSPVETDFGYHVIKVEDRKDTFAELKDSLIDTLTINKKNEKFNAFFADLMKNAEIENKLAEEAEQKKETQNE
ncbi:MAG: peptidylprolyl isomerase [Zhaonellaceae bacterium]